MAIDRRQFIKRGAGLVTLSVVAPKLWLGSVKAAADPTRRILVVIQLAGGNDGLNTVIPYTDSTYASMRPTLGFKESDLADSQGATMLISNQFALHPSMSEIRDLYTSGKVAIVLGVGYPNPNLSHFSSMDIWHTADLSLLQGAGWLGKYADIKLAGKTGLTAAALGSDLPKSLFANQVVIPNIASFSTYDYLTDPLYPGDRVNQINTFNQIYARTFPEGAFIAGLDNTGQDAVTGAAQVQAAVGSYSSTVTYPSGNPLASALKMAAQVITTIPGADLLYVQLGGFDHHSNQIGTNGDLTNKLTGQHASLLNNFSEGVKAFYDDMTQHGLADNVVLMQWSEFGRRPGENASFGTDHGTAAPLFVIGNPIVGGFYGQQPSLTDLDNAGNIKFKVDFRSVYATILDRWLGADSNVVLGQSFEQVGFLG